MDPRDQLIAKIVGRAGHQSRRRTQKARRLFDDLKQDGLVESSKEYSDWSNMVLNCIGRVQQELTQGGENADRDAIKEALAQALQAVMNVEDSEEEDDAVIQDTVDGTVAQFSKKGLQYDPFWGSTTTTRPRRDVLREVQRALRVHPFWGVRTTDDEE